MQRIIPSEYKGLYQAARDQGWTVAMTGSGHLKWTNPQGRSCFSPSSPGDRRGYHRVVQKLRAFGLVIQPDKHQRKGVS